MASENLINELFEIVQANSLEKIAFNDFEKDLLKNINLPNDEIDRALALILSQAEVNPNVIGETKGGTFVVSPSFSAAVISTIKYENQFIQGKEEYQLRVSNENSRDSVIFSGTILMTAGLIDNMLNNYENLSIREREELVDNISNMTNAQLDKLHQSNKKEVERIKNGRHAEIVKDLTDEVEKNSKEIDKIDELLKDGSPEEISSAVGDVEVEVVFADAGELFEPTSAGSEGKLQYESPELVIVDVSNFPIPQEDPVVDTEPNGIESEKPPLPETRDELSDYVETTSSNEPLIYKDHLDIGAAYPVMSYRDVGENFLEGKDVIYQDGGTFFRIDADSATIKVYNRGTIQANTGTIMKVTQNLSRISQSGTVVGKDLNIRLLEGNKKQRLAKETRMVGDSKEIDEFLDAVDRKNVDEIIKKINSFQVLKTFLEKKYKGLSSDEFAKIILSPEGKDLIQEFVVHVSQSPYRKELGETELRTVVRLNESGQGRFTQLNDQEFSNYINIPPTRKTLLDKVSDEFKKTKEEALKYGNVDELKNAYSVYRKILKDAKELYDNGKLEDANDILKYIRQDQENSLSENEKNMLKVLKSMNFSSKLESLLDNSKFYTVMDKEFGYDKIPDKRVSDYMQTHAEPLEIDMSAIKFSRAYTDASKIIAANNDRSKKQPVEEKHTPAIIVKKDKINIGQFSPHKLESTLRDVRLPEILEQSELLSDIGRSANQMVRKLQKDDSQQIDPNGNPVPKKKQEDIQTREDEEPEQ